LWSKARKSHCMAEPNSDSSIFRCRQVNHGSVRDCGQGNYSASLKTVFSGEQLEL
jgi:hypothetical protein